LRTSSSFDLPASAGIPGWLTPFAPWQLAQLAATLRPGSLVCACAAAAANATATLHENTNCEARNLMPTRITGRLDRFRQHDPCAHRNGTTFRAMETTASERG
jgi:hypothetical protein